MNKNDIVDVVTSGVEIIYGLVPGALGAAVATAYEKGLTWAQRFGQIAVGIIVSWFAGQAFSAFFSFGPFVQQSVSFVAGLVAYRAVPGFIAAFAATAKSVPGDVWENVKSWFRRPE
jgi:hypothetical protein